VTVPSPSCLIHSPGAYRGERAGRNGRRRRSCRSMSRRHRHRGNRGSHAKVRIAVESGWTLGRWGARWCHKDVWEDPQAGINQSWGPLSRPCTFTAETLL